MQSQLAERRPISIADLQVMLRDHVHSPRSICRHEVVTAPVDEQYRTVTGVIMDLEEKVLYVTDGPPCENSFERLAL
jgi:isopenicillin-N N-acyltransferase-like protein